MKKLLVDVDGVISYNDFARIFNEYFKTNYTYGEIRYDTIDKIITKEQQDVFCQHFAKQDYYRDAPLIEGAKEVLEKLSKTYDIYIVTATIYTSDGISANCFYESKYKMLRRNFPFIDPKKYVFANNKDIIKGDIFIDDSFKHFVNNYSLQKILFTNKYNKHITDEELKKHNVMRVDDWQQIYEILK